MDPEPEGILSASPEITVNPEEQEAYINRHPKVYKGKIYRDADGIIFFAEVELKSLDSTETTTATASFSKEKLKKFQQVAKTKKIKKKNKKKITASNHLSGSE